MTAHAHLRVPSPASRMHVGVHVSVRLMEGWVELLQMEQMLGFVQR
jgi:hypothetical protein